MVDPRRCLNPRVVVTRELPDPIMERMAALFDTHLNRTDEKWSQAQLAEAMATCDVLVPTVTDSIDAGLIAGAGPRLKLIANFGAGVNHIDLKAARARGIIVTNTPGVLTEDTADMTMALILSVPRRLAEGEKLVRSGAWKGWSPGGMLGHRIGGKALGIVGMGRIGQAVARRARAFGLSIHYHNRRRLPLSIEAELNAQWYPDLDAMLGAVDIVSIHTPLNADSHDLIDRRRIGLMRAHVYLINASRAGGRTAGGRGARRMAPRTADRPAPARAPQCGADAAYGLRHAGRPCRLGREGHRQYSQLGRWPSPTRSGAGGVALGVSRVGGAEPVRLFIGNQVSAYARTRGHSHCRSGFVITAIRHPRSFPFLRL